MLKLIPTKDDIITKLKIENDDCKALNFELKNKLTKYKRAFEILKKYNNVKFDFIDKKIIYYLDQENQAHIISKEEAELLEELMKGE